MQIYSQFTEEEEERNTFGPSYIFTHSTSALSKALAELPALTSTAAPQTNGHTADAATNGHAADDDVGVWLPASEHSGFSGTLKPAKVES